MTCRRGRCISKREWKEATGLAHIVKMDECVSWDCILRWQLPSRQVRIDLSRSDLFWKGLVASETIEVVEVVNSSLNNVTSDFTNYMASLESLKELRLFCTVFELDVFTRIQEGGRHLKSIHRLHLSFVALTESDLWDLCISVAGCMETLQNLTIASSTTFQISPNSMDILCNGLSSLQLKSIEIICPFVFHYETTFQRLKSKILSLRRVHLNDVMFVISEKKNFMDELVAMSMTMISMLSVLLLKRRWIDS